MKMPTIPVAVLVMVCVLGVARSGEAQCLPEDGVRFVCGPVNPEDLAAVPGSPWVIVSGYEVDGYLYATDTRTHRSMPLFPTSSFLSRPDPSFSDCAGPVTAGFQPHGLSLRPGSRGTHTLYVVRHGAREAVEVFEVDARGAQPSLTWVGCVVVPEGVTLNSVAALPGAGFAVTHFDLSAGELLEWQPDTGWATVPGSETEGPNGLVASPDGRWFYIAAWPTRSLIRLSRGQTPVQRDVLDIGFHVDNIRWAPDGSLLAAGHLGRDGVEAIIACLSQRQCEGMTSRVARVDPERLTAEEIVRYPSNEHFFLGTVALQVQDEIWLGGIGGADRIVRFPAP